MLRFLPLLFAFASSMAIAQSSPAPAPQPAGARLMLHFIEGTDWAPLPFDIVEGEILFRATINGQPATVLLDNGSSRTVIDTGFAARANVTLGGPADGATTGAATRLAARSTGVVRFEAPRAFTLTGPLVALDLKPMSTALGRPVDAILGSDVLDNFAVMIQPGAKQLSLVSSGGITVGSDAVVIPLVDGGKVDAVINGQTIRLKLDYGFSGLVRLTDAAWARVIPAGYPTTADTQTTADGVKRVTRRARADMKLGPAAVREAPISNGYVASGPSIEGILGSGFFLQTGSIVDVRRKQLILLRPTAASKTP